MGGVITGDKKGVTFITKTVQIVSKGALAHSHVAHQHYIYVSLIHFLFCLLLLLSVVVVGNGGSDREREDGLFGLFEIEGRFWK